MKITKDQARGMLVGKAVGDALGAPLEFEPKCRELNNLVSDIFEFKKHFYFQKYFDKKYFQKKYFQKKYF